MKKFLFLFGIISLFITESIALAVTIGIEPPAGYMNNLKTCTKSYNKTTALCSIRFCYTAVFIIMLLVSLVQC